MINQRRSFEKNSLVLFGISVLCKMLFQYTNPQKTENLFIFTEEILLRKIYFLSEIEASTHLRILRLNKSLHEIAQIRSFFWSVLSCIRTKYWGLLRKSPYLVWIQENTDQKKTPYMDNFHAVNLILIKQEKIVAL